MGGRNEQAQMRGNRSVNNIITRRTVSKAHRVKELAPNTTAKNEADSNANTCCLGQNFIPLSYTNLSANVFPYSDAYEPLDPNGETYILVFHKSLYYGSAMKHSLINPNVIRFNGLDFADNPMCDERLLDGIVTHVEVQCGCELESILLLHSFTDAWDWI